MRFRNLNIYSDHGHVNEEYIRQFEHDFHIKLPTLYRELLMQHNAPWCEQDYFEYYGLNNEVSSSSFGFKGFKTELSRRSLEDIYAQYIYDDPDYGYEYVYSFGSSGEGNYICFDYREDPTGDEPKICIVIHDEYDDETGKMLLFPVANNFEEFLDNLKSFDEIMAKYSEE